MNLFLFLEHLAYDKSFGQNLVKHSPFVFSFFRFSFLRVLFCVLFLVLATLHRR